MSSGPNFDLGGRHLRIEPRFDRVNLRLPPGLSGKPAKRREPPPTDEEIPRFPAFIEPSQQDTSDYDVCAMTPRQMVDFSYDIYVLGHLSWDQYAELAHQSELMPNFNQTIGALTGERAEPDRPRDYIVHWRRRLEFETRYLADDPRIIARAQAILDLLISYRKSTPKIPP